jgi:hypothetical protein
MTMTAATCPRRVSVVIKALNQAPDIAAAIESRLIALKDVSRPPRALMPSVVLQEPNAATREGQKLYS